ncbi:MULTISPECIES: LysR substrate-binding domain-containing protein [Paraburkholderia]|uniref:LysR family transcriptional regulator n=1 Tax=Paraburkholderia largidicola TaxID=3014751 RepID=A0A7I8BSP4_9BURK|nr:MULTISPECIES: LysR substrate-binding domain-containing protein [Paraburkholderia]BCF91702.1 LysR family transcriptional regulator [Paraburkholderia sp. PGU16]BEU25501.1 LysR substrate-binding domain-containing protein [Paraburkholderia sp. 22B1P]GJH04686.1 LysR family transcriptional regulator [Paraburkholderia terrae]
MRTLPSLNALRAFEVCGRLLSVQLAANELNVTPAAVSRQIKLLEDQLGVLLFERGHRAIALTPMGERYLADVVRGFETLRTATINLTEARRRRTLKIRGYTTFSMNWLLPRLSTFHREHPDIEVSLTTSLQPVDFNTEDVDAAIRLSHAPSSDLGYDRLVPNELVPVCSPEFLRAHPDLADATPEALRNVPLLHSLARREDWAKWLDAAGVRGVNPLSGLSYESSILAYFAATQGVGVAMAQRVLVADQLRDGTLVMPFSFVLDQGAYTYYLIYPREHLSNAEFAAFRNWLLSIGEAPDASSGP